MHLLETVLVLVGRFLIEGHRRIALRMFRCRAMRFQWETMSALMLLVTASGCASPPPNAYIQPSQPEQELATLDWGGAVWGGWRAPDVTAINGKPVAAFGSITKITPGKHTIDFEHSIYRGPYTVPAHSYVHRTLTFTAEAGHRYRLFTDCYSLGSSQCSSWIENETASVVVAGKLPRWADPDLASRSEDAAKLRERQALFEEQLKSVCAGDRPASQVALYFLAGIGPFVHRDLTTAHVWYTYGSSRGDLEASAILQRIEPDLSSVQLPQAGDTAALLPATFCSEGKTTEIGKSVIPKTPPEGM